MTHPVSLVFYGEVLPGFEPDQVKKELAHLLGIDPPQVIRVFSGQRIVLKSGMTETDAARYVEHLNRLGARVLVEPQGTPATTLPPVPPPPENHAAVIESVCPVCAEVQPKRTLCRKCGAHMAGIQAAEATAQAEAAMLREAEMEIRERNGGRLESEESNAAVPKIFSFDFSGRMGRKTYLLANFLISPLTLILLLIAMRDRNIALIVAALVLPAIINLRASVLRCHDINLRGWWVLASLMPYLGSIFWLILLVAPGKKATNDYGDVPGETPGKHVLAGLALVVLVAIVTLPKLFEEGLKMVSSDDPDVEATAHQEGAAAAEPPQREAPRTSGDATPTATDGRRKSYDGSINIVLLYTVGDCVPCNDRRRELTRIGLYPREVRVDLNEPAADEMITKLVKAGLPVSSLQMPVIDVNGTLLNNPSSEQVEQHLR